MIVTLHEWGHAIIAHWGGDHAIAEHGYLTLNPFRYIHPLHSVIFPLLFLLIGGIGLPGAAVYINEHTIRRRTMRTFMSLAGVLVNGVGAIILAIPFLLGWHQATLREHYPFWSGLALLIWLELFSILLCLTPLPGSDGFGAVKPYLPISWVMTLQGYANYSYLLLIFFFLRVEAIRNAYFFLLNSALQLLKIDFTLVNDGWRLFRFWGH